MTPVLTFPIEECARQILGTDDAPKVRWLAVRLRSGALPGYKADRKWRMTSDQIAEAIRRLTPRPAELPDVSQLMAGMTARSRRKLAG